MKTLGLAIALAVAIVALGPSVASAQDGPPMGFFVTSVGSGDGGNLGGLAGADARCQMLATAAGSTRTWRAYLSAAQAGGRGAPPQAVVNARDRIGTGPWYNAAGALIASNVDDLHMDRNNIRKPTALDESGNMVNGVGDTPNQHDMLTGSDSTGRVATGAANVVTCTNWTSNATTDRTILGHHDRLGGGSASWNATHSSAGCSQENLVQTGGNGLFYCFAID
jgi:hypothetical protein